MRDYQQYNNILYSHLSGSFQYGTFNSAIVETGNQKNNFINEERYNKLLVDFEKYAAKRN